MSNEKRYDTKLAKRMLLHNVGLAFYELGRVNSENTYIEEELLENAMYEVLKKDTGSRGQYKKLLELSYMVRGIADNLRLLSAELAQSNFDPNELPF